MKTLLVEKLIESHKLSTLSESLPACEERERLEKQRADCERIISYLMERFANLNRQFSNLDSGPVDPALIDVKSTEEELRKMEGPALLLYGSSLRYVCAAEASLQETPLAVLTARLGLVQVEWRRRCGNSILADFI